MDIDGVPFEDLPASPTRASAPSAVAPARPKRDKSALWKLVKQSVARDVLSLPVNYLEPLSFLQRLAEDVEYSSLLDRAADPALASADRAALVAAFVISHYSSTRARTLKPLNPLLGETFELVSKARRVALVAEQVSHHPPVSAVHARGRHWVYRATQRVRTSVNATSVEAWPAGTVHVEFPHLSRPEHYVYEKARSFVNNLVLGTLWLDNAGVVRIRELNIGDTVATVEFKRSSSRKTLGRVSGRVCLAANPDTPVRTIEGSWTSHIDVDGETVWHEVERPGTHATGGHEMTAWGWDLNCTPAGDDVGATVGMPGTGAAGANGECCLPCTDSRWRPDQRLLEMGEYKEAQKKKKRLEELQRERRGQAAKAGTEFKPRWFERAQGDGEEWAYTHKYFATKAAGWPTDLPRIHDTES